MNLIPALSKVLDYVANKNKENKEVKTADPIVFEELKKKWEKVEPVEPQNREESIYDILNKKVEEAKVENEANPQVETAHGSVFDNILRELEKLKNDGSSPQILERQTNIPPVVSQGGYEAPPIPENNMMRAMTNSNGGSLQIRQQPDMGAPVHQTVRVPDSTLITVLEYSDNSIILDGRKSRFALIDYNGVRGWILESYLNFN